MKLKGSGAVYRILIAEDDMGIAQAIKEQAEMWDLQAKCVDVYKRQVKREVK